MTPRSGNEPGRAVKDDPGVPAHVASLARQAIDSLAYPPETFPRHWFPDLHEVLARRFAAAWLSDPAFRARLAAAGEAQATEIIAAALGLPELLANHPRDLLLIYRQMITGFVRRLHRRPDECQDIVQEIYARLLAGKLAQIQKRYDAGFGPSPFFTSYFMVCIRNMYIDVVREGRNLMTRGGEELLPSTGVETVRPVDSAQTALLEEEFTRLRAILRLHPASRDRILLCLKLRCRLPVSADDVRRCFPACSAQDILQLGADFRAVRDRDMYRAVVPAFNRNELRPVQADTLRKWVENKTRMLIDHMNRLHREDVYDGGNITDLISLFLEAELPHAQG